MTDNNNDLLKEAQDLFNRVSEVLANDALDAPSKGMLMGLLGGDVTPPDSHGHKCPIKKVEAAKVGTRDSGAITLYRVNFFVDAWTSGEALYPSSRIWRSFYITFDGLEIRDETIAPNEIKSKFQSTI
jgi:hypothetical protein